MAINMLEQARQISPDGKQMDIAKVMSKAAPLLGDFKWVASNDTWSHKTVREATDYSATLQWRALNERKTGTEVNTSEEMDVIGMMEEFLDTDIKLVDTNPSPQKFRIQRASSKLRRLAEGLNYSFLYTNNAVTPKAPHGLMPRINSLGTYCLSAGGGAALTSILIVTHDDMDGVYGIYPKSLQAPGGDFMIQHKATETARLSETSAGKMYVYDDSFEFVGGIVVANPACLGRIANIPSATVSVSAIEDLLITLKNKMEIGPGTVIYMNEDVMTGIEIRMKDKGNVSWSADGGKGLFGEAIPTFRGIPIKKIDSRILLNSESTVS